MKLSKEKRLDSFSSSWTKTGKMKGYVCTIYFDALNRKYFFLLNGGDHTFNSLWEKLEWDNEEDCLKAAEEHIKHLAKSEMENKS